MSKLPVVDAKTFEKILLQLGFKIIRQKGSHVFYRHIDGRYTTLPHHKGQAIDQTNFKRNKSKYRGIYFSLRESIK